MTHRTRLAFTTDVSRVGDFHLCKVPNVEIAEATRFPRKIGEDSPPVTEAKWEAAMPGRRQTTRGTRMPLRSIAASFGVVGLLGWVAVVGPANAALASSESVAHATTVPFGRSTPTCLKVLPISLLKTYVGSVLYLEEQSPKRDSAEGIQQCFFSKKCPACSTGRVFGYVSVTLNNNEPLALFRARSRFVPPEAQIAAWIRLLRRRDSNRHRHRQHGDSWAARGRVCVFSRLDGLSRRLSIPCKN